jgi:acetyltransferase
MPADTTSHREIAEPSTSPLSAQAAAVGWTRDAVTNIGYRIHIRPARPDDEAAVAKLFAALTPDDLRHRFLSSLRQVRPEVVRDMVRDDDPHRICFLAFEQVTGELIATALLAAERDYASGEFALATHPDRKGRGVSWALLDHLVGYAADVGIAKLVSIETADDAKALELERQMGFTVRTSPDDATLMIAEKMLR